MSIKPHFAEEILSKRKKFELRARVAPIETGDIVILYASSPAKSIVGMFRVGKVYVGSLDEILRIVRSYPNAGISDEDLKYVVNRKRQIQAIEVLAPKKFPRPITYDEIRARIPNFRPPVSYVRLRANSPLLELLKSILKSYEKLPLL